MPNLPTHKFEIMNKMSRQEKVKRDDVEEEEASR